VIQHDVSSYCLFFEKKNSLSAPYHLSFSPSLFIKYFLLKRKIIIRGGEGSVLRSVAG
jgi:hypothetical protein